MIRGYHGYLLLGVLSLVIGIRGQLECPPETQTKIPSPVIDDYEMAPCADWISAPPDLSRMDFREECQRWLVLDELPDHVENYYIDYCVEYSTYTRYEADICCAGVVTNVHCFKCTNFTSDSTCYTEGDIEMCTAGQVCQTTSKFYNNYPSTVMRKTTGCSDEAVCEQADDNDVNTCKDWIPAPACTDCCSVAFCNDNTPGYDKEVADTPCVSNPCMYGGTCSYDLGDWTYTCTCTPDYTGDRCQTDLTPPTPGPTTTPAPTPPPSPCSYYPCENGAQCYNQGNTDYHCYCRQGWGGKNCTDAYGPCPAGSDYCKNGGSCIDHGTFGYRCNCPKGFVGSQCEIANLTCTASIGLDYETNQYYSSNTNCTDIVMTERQNGETDSSNMNNCLSHMQQPGKPTFRQNVDGYVDALESASFWYCEAAEERSWYSEEYCCPSCYSLPCQNGAWCIQDKDETYICKCRFGWTGTQCQNKKNLCVISGDPHYWTFDGQILHYQGNGNYQLSGNSQSSPQDLQQFTITGRNSPAGCSPSDDGDIQGKVTYLQSMKVHLYGYGVTVELYKCNSNPHDPAELCAKLDGEPLLPGDTIDVPGIFIFWSGLFVVLEVEMTSADPPAIMTVEYSGQCQGSIDLPPEYTDLVEGICGDADGDPLNDLTTSDGVDVTNATNKYSLVGGSWEVNATQYKSGRDIEEDIVIECPAEFEDDVSSNVYCGLIKDTSGAFSSCIQDTQIDEVIDYENCHYDVCAFVNDTTDNMKFMACRSLETFALKCESQGHVINWRDTAGCPVECKNSTEYSFSASACHATCGWPDAPEQCHLPNREGCFCPKDMVLDENGMCQDAQICGCVDESGKRWKIGDSWLSSDCTTNNTCVVCTECTRPVGKIVSEPHSCTPDEVCVPLGDGDHQCQNNNCPGCSCTDGSGRVWQIGENGLSVDCAWNMTCIVCEECTPPVGSFWKEEHSCSPTERCVVDDGIGQCQAALHSEVTGWSKWSKWSKWSACLKTGDDNWIQYRTRRCVYPDVTSAHVTCHGNYIDQKPCVKQQAKKKNNKKHNEI